MRKKILILTAVIIFVALILFIIKIAFTSKVNNPNNKIQVITTLFPLYDIAKKIGGESANVSLLLDPGMEAHSFEPTPSDMIKISQANIFIYTGKFMETWAEDILSSINNENLLVVNASDSVVLLSTENASHDNDHKSVSSNIDPHIWLNFDNLKIMVRNIEQGFIKADPNNSDLFNTRAQEYLSSINNLDSQYASALENCEHRNIIYSGHYAFAYLARKYNLHYQSAYGLSPNSEPGAQALIDITRQIKKTDTQYIFLEELMSPNIFLALNNETGTQALSLSTAHNLSKDDLEAGVSLFDVFNKNLNNLKIGLHCQ